MKIELATIQDVPALLDLQRKAFGQLCEELDWKDAPVMSESLEHAYEEFARCTTLKVQNEDGRIIGSIHGNVTDDSLYIGRLMVLPEYQQQGIGKQLFREIQSRLPHRRAWLCTCQQVRPPYEFYLREGFKPFKSEEVGPGLTWVYMEKAYSYLTLRPFTIDDAPIILSWIKDKTAFRKWSADRYPVYPPKPEDMQAQYTAENVFPFTAIDDNGKVVGHIMLRYPDPSKTVIAFPYSRCRAYPLPFGQRPLVRFGFVIVDDQLRGKGYGKQMLQLAIQKAKEEFGAKKITLGVFDNNPSAFHCYESVGFKVIGTDSYLIDGEEWTEKEMEIRNFSYLCNVK